MTAPREAIPTGLKALQVHVWFTILQVLMSRDFSNFNTDKKTHELVLRINKFYAPDPESPIPARVNAAVMGL